MLQWPVLEMTMMLNLIHSRTKGLEYPTHEEYSHGATLCIPWIPKSPNHQITKFQVFVFRYSGSVVRYGHSCLAIQAQCSGLCLGAHIQYSYSGSQIQVFRFRYSGLEFRLQDWVYRLADKYKALTFSIHIQGIQVWVYRLACIPKPVYPNLNT